MKKLTFTTLITFFLIISSKYDSQLNAQQFQNAQETFGKYVTWGTVWGDYNNDGFTDLYLSNGQQDYEWEGLLYKNNGDGTFDSVATAGDIVNEKYTSGGSSWGDYNNDGYLDMYVANVVKKSGFSYNYLPNSLHTNNGDGTFTKETTGSVGDIVATQSSSSGAVEWLDYNNDGLLDAATSNATLFGAANNLLYQNSGSPNYTFSSVSNTFTNTGQSMRAGLSAVDFDEDGDIDIVVVSGNEFNDTRLYKNSGSPSYDFTVTTLLSSTKPTQGAAWGDIDNDGDFDLYLANGGTDGTPSSPTTNNLFRNNNGTLTEITSGVGPLITDADFSYAPAFGDFDNDGDLDLFVGNDGSYLAGYRSRLYSNDGNGIFSYYSTVLADSSSFARSAAWADIDNDGDLDLMVGREGQNRLFINNGNSNKWSEIKAIGDGTTSNAKAIGALVKVNATINSNTYTQIRDVSSQSSRGSHNDLRTHFGLGNASKINSLSVKWPGPGTTSSMTDLPTNKIIVFTQGNLSATANVIKQQNFMYLFGNSKSAVEFTTNTDTDGGTLTVTKTESDPGGTFDGSSATSAGGTTITPDAVVNDRYWTITESGLTGNFTTTVYLDASSLPSGVTVDDLTILKRANSGSDWTALNTSKIGNTVFASGITSFSEFALGYKEKVLVEVKIFLEGPYSGTEMTTNLGSDIPLTSPYSEDPRTVTSIPADVTDWILVQLRTTDNGTAITSKSAFLRKDGIIIADDGTEHIEMDAPADDYYIVIKHRNHLAVMSASKVALNMSSSTLYDFTSGSGQFYGTDGAKQIGN